MSGLIGANHLVAGIFYVAAHVSYNGIDDPGNPAKPRFRSPEASRGEGGDSGSRHFAWLTSNRGRPLDGRPLMFLHFDGINDLYLGKPEQSQWPVFHPNSRPLRAAEWQVGGDRQMLIDPCRSALEPLGNIGLLVHVVPPHRPDKGVLGGIGEPQSIINIFV